MRAVRPLVLAIAAALLATGTGNTQGVPPGTSPPQAAAHEGQERTPAEWRAAAREDILAAYDIFSRHHPGMFDPANPGFPAQLRRARDTALAFLPRVNDLEGQVRAVDQFSAVLADGHARAQIAYPGHNVALWPGFRTVWRGNALYVSDPGRSGLSRGAMLVACDGRNARTAIREDAFSWGGRPAEAGQWWEMAPGFFSRVRSPYETMPRTCRFRSPDGRATSLTLDWQPVTMAQIRDFVRAAQPGPVGMTEPRPGIRLITLSDFSPGDAGVAAYHRLFAGLESGMAQIGTGRAVILDLRRNNGGSSRWSREVANRLWGESAVTAALARYFRRTTIRWLADEANIVNFREHAARYRREGLEQAAQDLDETVAHLETARARGDRFYVEEVARSYAITGPPAAPRPLPPVYVIVDGRCASACLDAVDLFTRFPGVRLMGAPTSADTNYMDIRSERLPSGRGIVILPTKIWVNRPRASGQIYRPQIPVNDLDWSTPTMLDHVERDLGRRAPQSGSRA